MTHARWRWHTAVAVVALLVLGAAAGITVDRFLHRRPAAHAIRLPDGTAVGFPDAHANPIALLDRAVGLRPDQRTRVAAIIDRRQADVNAAWHEARTRFRATVDSVIAEIAVELDPDQAARFRALVNELHGPHRERRLRH